MDEPTVTTVLRKMLPRLLEEREQKGIETYGQSLVVFNGRSAFQDLIEELVDACQYALQLELERREIEGWFRDALELLREAIDEVNLSPHITTEYYQDLARRETLLQKKAERLKLGFCNKTIAL